MLSSKGCNEAVNETSGLCPIQYFEAFRSTKGTERCNRLPLTPAKTRNEDEYVDEHDRDQDATRRPRRRQTCILAIRAWSSRMLSRYQFSLSISGAATELWCTSASLDVPGRNTKSLPWLFCDGCLRPRVSCLSSQVDTFRSWQAPGCKNARSQSASTWSCAVSLPVSKPR